MHLVAECMEKMNRKFETLCYIALIFETIKNNAQKTMLTFFSSSSSANEYESKYVMKPFKALNTIRKSERDIVIIRGPQNLCEQAIAYAKEIKQKDDIERKEKIKNKKNNDNNNKANDNVKDNNVKDNNDKEETQQAFTFIRGGGFGNSFDGNNDDLLKERSLKLKVCKSYELLNEDWLKHECDDDFSTFF